MERYIKKMSFLGENIQTIRKHRGMKQQELADKIGINMQSLSKIERGVNYPTFDTLEKIMDVLGVTPNELLSGEWKYIDHTEPYIMDIDYSGRSAHALKRVQRTGIAVQQSSAAVQPRPLGMG